MLNNIYKIKDSIDVYVESLEDSTTIIQFYRINTREKVTIHSNCEVQKIISILNGELSVREILRKHNIEESSLIELLKFLNAKGLVYLIKKSKNLNTHRFCRQTAFFDDLSPNDDGDVCQQKLQNSKVVIFGTGSVGGDIAVLLARMGVGHFILIDYKKVSKNSLIRHLFCNQKDINKFKTQVLREYIGKIDKDIKVEVKNIKITPNTNLKSIIPNDTSLVVNTADEPYIGHISIKLGRYLWKNNIALYIAGGFNAHSMSSGEIVIPHKTPCIDCYSNNFKIALKDWNPTYIIHENNKNKNQPIIGGSGSIAACSLFSASYACMCIVYYLLKIGFPMQNRSEYLINQGIFTKVKLTEGKNEKCEYCSK